MIFGAESCAIDFQTESVLVLNKKLKVISKGGEVPPPEEVLSPTAILNFPDQGIFSFS